MLTTHSLGNLIEKEFMCLPVSEPTKWYLISLFSLLEGPPPVTQGIILEWVETRQSGSFSSYQRLGDWITWRAGMSHMPLEFEEHHLHVACMSYNHCNRLLSGEWGLYDELSKNLVKIIGEIRNSFNKVNLVRLT